MVADIKRDSFTAYLDSFDFRFFSTFTTAKPLGLGATRKHASRLCKVFDVPQAFWCAEPFETRYGYHFHALMNMPTDHVPLMLNWWATHYGDPDKNIRARCDIKDNQMRGEFYGIKASQYCSKYITKRVSDYDFYVSNKPLNRVPEHTNTSLMSRYYNRILWSN